MVTSGLAGCPSCDKSNVDSVVDCSLLEIGGVGALNRID